MLATSRHRRRPERRRFRRRAVDVTGAGATFPYPVYAKWAETYKAADQHRPSTTSPSARAAASKQIKAKTVDFGASDKPLKAAELNAAGLLAVPHRHRRRRCRWSTCRGLQPGQLKPRPARCWPTSTWARSRSWNDPGDRRPEPGREAASTCRSPVVHRSDGSGTTFAVHQLSGQEAARAWASSVGANDAVKWPTAMGGKGNDGVAAFVKQTIGLDRLCRIRLRQAEQGLATDASCRTRPASSRSPSDGLRRRRGQRRLDKGPGLRPAAGPTGPATVAGRSTGATFILLHKHAGQSPPTGQGRAQVLRLGLQERRPGRRPTLDYVAAADAALKAGRSARNGRPSQGR